MSVKRTVFTLNIVFIATAVPFLLWFYYIDGHIIGHPIEYRPSTDPVNLQVTRDEWKRGELVTYYTSFCKVRDAVPTAVWALSNDTMTLFPERTNLTLPVGCYPENPDGMIIAQAEIIPSFAVAGCNHYFTAYVTRDIGGGRVIKDKVRTERFCVVD